ncbi:hypothetical protein [Herbidospora cretacea]|uniref:hypothetical protein n=1 Tax=Herbidospora cretacea TaxID=28444 RepID=UPI000A8CC511|nr:hypothetical protein [Herbidospora cretacea]
MARNYSNVAVQTTLTSGISNSATSLSVGTVTGYPAAPFTIIVDPGLATEELIEVGAVSGTDFNSCTRGIDGTPAQSHSSGSVVVHGTSARDFREANDHVTATTSVHGITNTANLVTLAGTQTLTNKTLTSPTINGGTYSGTLTGQPTISDFTNADHNHTNAANGGTLTTAAISGLEARLEELEEGGGGSSLPYAYWGAQSEQASGNNTIDFGTPTAQSGSIWSSGAPDKIVAPMAGIYLAYIQVEHQDASFQPATFRPEFTHHASNGGAIYWYTNTTTTNQEDLCRVALSATIPMAATDYLTVRSYNIGFGTTLIPQRLSFVCIRAL